ncbi:MAG TPA: methylenetetrahydrofolate reductase [Thermoanaerobaculia bacterium]|jgi:methylenetetrahydrofolate reductase (NADPH)|nr:methylenetetrahydrofolate reductase [Thermoanaerobaculia bacterium]
MKVIDHLARAERPLISFEIIPPLRGGNVNSLLALIDDLVKYRPPFIDITSHAAEVIYEETPKGIQRRVKRKRPGTLGVCALLQNKYQVDAVPHILCQSFTREETEDFLIELKYLGIDNVLAVRGDDSGYEKPLQHGRSANRYACDLVAQIGAMNRGRYLEEDLLDAEPSDFCIGVGGYPEKHFEAPNLQTDARHVKAKLDAGAHYVVTQMFFDNRHYFRFVELCRAAGITAPIIPGLKVLSAQKQLSSIPSNFHVEIPAELSDEVLAARPDQVLDIGVEWARRQLEELLAHGVVSAHFYVMQSATAIKRLMAKIKL